MIRMGVGPSYSGPPHPRIAKQCFREVPGRPQTFWSSYSKVDQYGNHQETTNLLLGRSAWLDFMFQRGTWCLILSTSTVCKWYVIEVLIVQIEGYMKLNDSPRYHIGCRDVELYEAHSQSAHSQSEM